MDGVDRSSGFFLFGSFSFFTIGCGNVGNSKAITARAGLRIKSPTRRMVTRRPSDPAQAGSQTHTQMMSFEDSAIRVAPCFWRAGNRKETELEIKDMEKQIRAWIGLDWADQKHDVSLYDVSTGKTERYELPHSPESIQEWIAGLRSRYGDGL